MVIVVIEIIICGDDNSDQSDQSDQSDDSDNSDDNDVSDDMIVMIMMIMMMMVMIVLTIMIDSTFITKCHSIKTFPSSNSTLSSNSNSKTSPLSL